jgi:preprotein translocase subunit Sec61beta
MSLYLSKRHYEGDSQKQFSENLHAGLLHFFRNDESKKIIFIE